MEVLSAKRSQKPIAWSVSYATISIVLSLFTAQAIYILCSINVLIGYSLLIFFLSLLFFSKYKVFLVYFYCWSVLFQNAFIAYSADLISSEFTFGVLHGTNFLITSVLFILVSLQRFKTNFKSILFLASILALLLLYVYCIIGFANYGLKNSLGYFRLFSMVFMMFWIGVYFSTVIREQNFRSVLLWIFFITLLSIVGQFFFPRLFITLMNDTDYYRLKGDANSMEEVIRILNTNTYFNIPALGSAIRAPGFIKSFISSAYFIVCLSIVLFWRNSRFLVWITFLVMSVCVASKGAFLCFFIFLLLLFLNHKFNLSLQTSLFLLLFLWIPIIILGYHANNEHLIGFVSGTKYLDTIGNGLGFSGNLSDVRLTSHNGGPLPDLGYWTRFYNGSESALGVLFSSLGVASLIYLFLLFKLLLNIYPQLKSNKQDYLALLSIIMIFQGIFQEEAFSPYAFGLVIFVTGFYYNYPLLTKVSS